MHSSHVALRHAPPCKGLVPRDWPRVPLFSSPSNPASQACMTFVFQSESHGCVINPIIGFANFSIWVLVSTAFSASLMPHQQKSSFWKSTSARCMLEHLPPNKRITASVMMQQLPRHVRHFWSRRFKYNNWYLLRSRDESHYCKYTCYIVLCTKTIEFHLFQVSRSCQEKTLIF